ncbi:hypothetical protein B6S12_04790 [Helicobacter valdiviensis]|uniref:Metallo-beta-lactamase domain-containing protein n=1 Tax=Helicobacter valdiviensis TaxID=1458358 RepID=A0A2W6MY64_9HELI|nr:MBL fold metallo-hydrolase [Helicobacter valdiviensis]PZT48248.1 hypothetical protein B6S12_04790 [Helicobacter valdiviensis]
MKIYENEYFYILREPFGEYQTNCYLACNKEDETSLIIDPGINATEWVLSNAKNPLCILNTHGHFDHVWSNQELKEKLKIPLLCPYEDAFMLVNDCFSTGLPSSTPDILVGAKEKEEINTKTSQSHNINRQNTFNFGAFNVKFSTYPGHTPGCSIITLSHQKNPEEEIIFSGDFIFLNCIGRSDFPYSSHQVMLESLQSFLENIQKCKDTPIFPGHGEKTSTKSEIESIEYFIKRLSKIA